MSEVVEEEAVESEEEVVMEDGGEVEEGEEVVEGEEAVARPKGDPVLEYVYGLTSEAPSSLGEWRFPWLLTELAKAVEKGDKAAARRWVRLIFAFCPAKPRLCPLYSLSSRCEWRMERRCRPLARYRAS